MPADVDDDLLRKLVSGTVCGVIAFLGGYLVTYAVVASRAGAIASDLAVPGDPATWKVVGWIFYAAHFGWLSVPGGAGTAGTPVLGAVDGAPFALACVPILALLVMGLIAGRLTKGYTAEVGAEAGVTLVAGYLPLVLLGLLLFRVSVTGGVVEPEPVSTLLFAGIGVPTVFGTVGGIVGVRT